MERLRRDSAVWRVRGLHAPRLTRTLPRPACAVVVVPDGNVDFEMNFASVNAFDDAEEDNFKMHIRIQQRNGRKSTTSIEGFEMIPFPATKFAGIDYKKILKNMKRNFKCNGAIVKDKETGSKVIQLQGDQRVNVTDWLVDMELCKKNQLVIHGF